MHIPCHAAGPEAKDNTSKYIEIHTDLLIPGCGEPIEQGVIVIEEGKIHWVGVYGDFPRGRGYDTIEGSLGPLHIAIHPSYLVLPLRVLSRLRTFAGRLRAGFTSVIKPLRYAGYLQPGIRNGYIVRPNVYSSLSALSITGDQGDTHDLPLSAVQDFGHGDGSHYLCDGVDECVEAVRSMVRRGAKCIKLCSSGGIISLNDDPEDRHFPNEELEIIADEAARSRRSVAARAIGKVGIMAALKAGVGSIEHGCYLDEEVVDLIEEKGAVLVATRRIQESLLLDHDDFPPPIVGKVEKLVPLRRSN
ncbi:Uu.00g048100.m01.CDS01 [Anthostomella pinea]|uniref:Uu.00g048100.m01.CDS01 n=1 Tax=Anthostomella pinea TaxID=933095 RepID=A0AAI8VCC9_9PEZI|nr:Uu.00g048100.m01.CDS01 [Anthostomella pinea]